MNKHYQLIWVALIATCCFGFIYSDLTDKGYSVGDVAMDFRLKNVDGRMVSLSDYKEAGIESKPSLISKNEYPEWMLLNL